MSKSTYSEMYLVNKDDYLRLGKKSINKSKRMSKPTTTTSTSSVSSKPTDVKNKLKTLKIISEKRKSDNSIFRRFRV